MAVTVFATWLIAGAGFPVSPQTLAVSGELVREVVLHMQVHAV